MPVSNGPYFLQSGDVWRRVSPSASGTSLEDPVHICDGSGMLAVLFDARSGTLHKVGEVGQVEAQAGYMRRKYANSGLNDAAADLVMISFPVSTATVDLANRCLGTEGYCLRLESELARIGSTDAQPQLATHAGAGDTALPVQKAEPVIERVARYTVTTCRVRQRTLFIFGDNLAKWGTAGQAVIRNEPNAVGIATKKTPHNFMSDADLQTARASWAPALDRLRAHLRQGGSIAWPADGIGTGLADLRRKAPSVWDALCTETRELFSMAGQARELVIIACGGRDYDDADNVDIVLGKVRDRLGMAELIEGGYRGADKLAGKWADENGIPRRTEKAQWGKYGKSAGYFRNRAMAEMLAERRMQTGCRAAIVAFPGDVGTRMMVSIGKEYRFKIIPAPDLAAEPEPEGIPQLAF